MSIQAAFKNTIMRSLPKSVTVRMLAYRAKARGDNPELELLQKYSRGGTFVDIGANIGDYSRVACLHYKDVIAFEPIPELAAKLKGELTNNVRIENVALSNVSGGNAVLRIPIAAQGETTGLASLESRAIADVTCREITVPLRRLDDYEISQVDMIKIDVEGHEAAVIQGATETIRRCHPPIIVEIEDRHHPGASHRVFDLMFDLGFAPHYYLDGKIIQIENIRNLTNINSINGQHVYNFVFLPKV